MGNGPFASGTFVPSLDLRVDQPTHGLVEPSFVMPISEYQALLEATRNEWTVDEE